MAALNAFMVARIVLAKWPLVNKCMAKERQRNCLYDKRDSPMSEAIQSPQDCCRPCPEPVVQNIPGPKGDKGDPGSNGTNGVSSFTTLTAPFTMPAEGASVTVAVGTSTWMTVNQLVFAGKTGSAAVGTFLVVSKPDGASAILQNLADTPTSAYLDNSAPGTVFPSATQVGPAGQQGAKGTDGSGGAPISATYITQTPSGSLSNEQALSALATGLVFNTTGTGVLTVRALGIANTNVAPVDGTMTAASIVIATASGITTQTVAQIRTLLGIGTLGLQSAAGVTITGGAISATTISGSTGAFTSLSVSGATVLVGILATTPSALQTVGAANVVAANGPSIRVAGSGPAVVLTSTPSIALGVSDGQQLEICGTDDTNTVAFQDNGTLAGSKVRLQATSRVLGKGDTLRVRWDAPLGFWIETSFSDLV